jgi:hypothetical protein
VGMATPHQYQILLLYGDGLHGSGSARCPFRHLLAAAGE